MTDIKAKPHNSALRMGFASVLFIGLVGGGLWYLLQGSNEKTNGDFTLTSSQGLVSLHDFRGKAVLLFFGYTHCPDICPATLHHVGEAFDLMEPAELANAQALFITVDPERDTPAHLAEYVRFFHTGIIGLSGSVEDIRRVARSYGVEFFREGKDGGDYQVIHTSRLFLINTAGGIADMMSHKTSPEDIATAVRRWLNPVSSS